MASAWTSGERQRAVWPQRSLALAAGQLSRAVLLLLRRPVADHLLARGDGPDVRPLAHVLFPSRIVLVGLLPGVEEGRRRFDQRLLALGQCLERLRVLPVQDVVGVDR